MNLIRYEPRTFPFFREMEEVSDRLNRFLGGRTRANGERESLVVTDWMPPVDIQEIETEYLVKAELPEVRKEDVKVTVENGVLTIQGERKQEKEEKGKKFHRVERSYGTFLRTFTVPVDAEENKVAADFKDGILRVHLPKTEKSRPKAIEVRVA
ncbi:MAG: Hsp20/alpha crystallin family protein [Thermoanaerobaculia bacterium]